LPVLAGTVRLGIVVAGSLLAVSLDDLFTVIALAIAAFGVLTAAFVARARWS
jgi:hypothetical protein